MLSSYKTTEAIQRGLQHLSINLQFFSNNSFQLSYTCFRSTLDPPMTYFAFHSTQIRRFSIDQDWYNLHFFFLNSFYPPHYSTSLVQSPRRARYRKCNVSNQFVQICTPQHDQCVSMEDLSMVRIINAASRRSRYIQYVFTVNSVPSNCRF